MPASLLTRRPASLVATILVTCAVAALLAACGSPAARTPATTAPAASTGTEALSTATTAVTAVAAVATTAPAATETPPGAAIGAAPTAGPTGAPRAAIAPQQSNPAAPRTNRSGFVVALDPGHGGDESGAAAYGVVERDSNLDLAQRVGEYLKVAGVQVYLTREDEGRATGLITPSGDNRSATRNDLQARVSAANRVGADVFVSLHSNGAADTSLRGVEVYYETRRPFADESYRLAQHLLDGALRGLANAGYPSTNRGIIDAACWRNFNGRCVGLFVLSPGGATTGGAGGPVSPAGGPGANRVKEATNMPAALLETLFVSSPDDAALLRDPNVRAFIARGIADGILRYLGVPA